MKTSSAKAKGRNLQKYVVARILHYFPSLVHDDVISRSMGSQGEDVMLSPVARKLLPISIECKNKKAFSIYKDYAQASSNSHTYHPIVVIKQNKSEPLAVMNLEYFLTLLKDCYA